MIACGKAIKTGDWLMNRYVIIVCYLVAGAVGDIWDQDVITSNNPDTSHQVMAFYYPWYGTPQGRGGQGKAVHWGRIDTSKKDIEASRNYPVMGAYDSHEPKVVQQHCTWARQAGIDTFIVSWWGHGSYCDQAMPLILETCAKHNMTACVYYEAVPEPKSPQSAADDIVKILEHYAGHPAYLKTGGRPVVFVYGRAVNDIGLYGWYQARQLINQKFKGGAALIGDQMNYAAANVFDVTHTYNTCGQLADKTIEQTRNWTKEQYGQWVFMAEDLGALSTLTIIPGYDDTKIRKPGLNTKRLDGQLYQAQWDAALSYGPDWVIITSFNEWHEGSEIEPSEQYGDRYLKLTEQNTKKFKALTPGPVLYKRKRYYSPQYPELKNKLQGKTIAVLPNPESAAFWFLLKAGVNIKVLSWKDIAEGLDPKTFAMVLYAGPETYCTTAQKKDDVDAAIVNYLKAGGTLVVLSSGPLPFYYDQDGKAINRASKLGLNIDMGWERPPQVTTIDSQGRKETTPTALTFVNPEEKMQDTGEKRLLDNEIAFSSMNELRWRPFIAEAGTKSTPLLTLKDKSNGRSYGDGLVIVYPESGGRIAYGWSGLLQSSYAEIVCSQLFDRLTQ
jgi:glycoprotein endo-alpha-1,2-mannosidase